MRFQQRELMSSQQVMETDSEEGEREEEEPGECDWEVERGDEAWEDRGRYSQTSIRRFNM